MRERERNKKREKMRANDREGVCVYVCANLRESVSACEVVVCFFEILPYVSPVALI